MKLIRISILISVVLCAFLSELQAQIIYRVASLIELNKATQGMEDGFLSTNTGLNFGMGFMGSVQYSFIKMELQLTAEGDEVRKISNQVGGGLGVKVPVEVRLFYADKLKMSSWFLNPYIGARWMNGRRGIIEQEVVIIPDWDTDYELTRSQNQKNVPLLTGGIEIKPSKRMSMYPSILIGVQYAFEELERGQAVGTVLDQAIDYNVSLRGLRLYSSIRFIF